MKGWRVNMNDAHLVSPSSGVRSFRTSKFNDADGGGATCRLGFRFNFNLFESDLSDKARDPSIHFWVVGEDEVSNPESRLSIFCHLDHPWPSEEGSLRSGHIDGSVHYRCLPASVFQDQAQTVHGALRRWVFTTLPSG